MLTFDLLVDQQAGINLNLFGAIAGAFSGSETKETDTEGNSTEYREGRGNVQGKLDLNYAALAALVMVCGSKNAD